MHRRSSAAAGGAARSEAAGGGGGGRRRKGGRLYSVLGVEPAASQDEIKQAHRRLALEFHPDRAAKGFNPGSNFEPLDPAAAEARFKEVQAAYEVLSDPEQRKQYDAFGEGALNGGQMGMYFSPGTAGNAASLLCMAQLLLLLLLLTAVLVALKIDGHVGSPWAAALVPVWLIDLALLPVPVSLLSRAFCGPPPKEQDDPSGQNPPRWHLFLAGIRVLAGITFTATLCAHLDDALASPGAAVAPEIGGALCGLVLSVPGLSREAYERRRVLTGEARDGPPPPLGYAWYAARGAILALAWPAAIALAAAAAAAGTSWWAPAAACLASLLTGFVSSVAAIARQHARDTAAGEPAPPGALCVGATGQAVLWGFPAATLALAAAKANGDAGVSAIAASLPLWCLLAGLWCTAFLSCCAFGVVQAYEDIGDDAADVQLRRLQGRWAVSTRGELRAGKAVRAEGLRAAPELNGRLGVLCAWRPAVGGHVAELVDASPDHPDDEAGVPGDSAGRWQVQFEGEVHGKALKLSNLRPAGGVAEAARMMGLSDEDAQAAAALAGEEAVEGERAGDEWEVQGNEAVGGASGAMLLRSQGSGGWVLQYPGQAIQLQGKWMQLPGETKYLCAVTDTQAVWHDGAVWARLPADGSVLAHTAATDAAAAAAPAAGLHQPQHPPSAATAAELPAAGGSGPSREGTGATSSSAAAMVLPPPPRPAGAGAGPAAAARPAPTEVVCTDLEECD